MFIGNEIRFLEKYFEIQVAPLLISSSPLKICENIKIDHSLNAEIKKNKFLRAFQVLSSFKFYSEILAAIKLNRIPNLISIIHFVDLFVSTNKWIKKQEIINKYDVIYTYWLSAVTSAFSGQKLKPLIISRVHGYDIYEERYKSNYIVGIRNTLQNLDVLYTISNHAIKYINSNYNHKCKLVLARLGVASQVLTVGNLPESLHLVSCSSVISLKRVDNLLKAVLMVAEKNSNLKIKWTHLGDGHELPKIKDSIRSMGVSNNLIISFPGNYNHDEVISFYKNNKVDLFIHASETEGLPVSMQEAHSFGIPIVSTNVGGVSEIVVDGTGFLINSENTVIEMHDRINEYILLSQKSDFRTASIKNQLYNFNMEVNYEKFTLNILQNCHN
jgi:colanic acid/amylovoran biosynthesis glycosyltransferase